VLQYADTVVFLRTHVKVILHILAVTFVQRCAVFGLTYFVYRGMGLSGTGAIPVMALQAVVYITVDMLPLPGSQGVTELVYAAIFGAVFTGGTLTISMCDKRHQLLPAADYQCDCGRVLLSEEEKRNCTNLTAASVRLELRTMPI
jgi:hypothetical protein